MTFKCFIHTFETDKIEEWDEHNQKEEHTVIGRAPCSLCGIIVDFKFTGKRKIDSIPSICKECRSNF